MDRKELCQDWTQIHDPKPKSLFTMITVTKTQNH